MKPKIVVYHSVLGVRQGERHMAALLERLGFAVQVPDLYDGKVFNHYDEAIQFFEEMGVAGLIERAKKALEGENGPFIFTGFSNGGALAEVMALQYPETVGCILFHAALPITEIGAAEWPRQVPVQLHYADEDPWREEEYVKKFLQQVEASGAAIQFCEYQSTGHLFSDNTLPDEYSKEETEKMYRNVIDFLEQYT